MEYHEYWQGVRDLARNIKEKYPDIEDAQDAIHERVGSHYWISFPRYHLYILMYSDNEEAMTEMGIGKPSSVAEFVETAAFYAIQADVQEAFQELI